MIARRSPSGTGRICATAVGRTRTCYSLRDVAVGRISSRVDLTADEGFDRGVRGVVVLLVRRRLHEVRGRADECSPDAAVQTDLRGADRVDDDAGAVGRVPDLELVLDGHGGVAEVASLEPHEGPFRSEERRVGKGGGAARVRRERGTGTA